MPFEIVVDEKEFATMKCPKCNLPIDAYPDLPCTTYDDIWTGGTVLFNCCNCEKCGEIEVKKIISNDSVEMANKIQKAKILEEAIVFEESK